ncbi:MAG: hypothetical protein KJ808_10200 [Acidobacteria bacterium]|nr:hypothetical protein [Acidobacteriota bacterium]MCG2812772.1 hypothetical protein [Candidatus Aminicenantes bacterium]
MSYFMIAVGAKPDLGSIPPLEALPIQQAQEYLRRLIPIIAPKEHPSSVWFIHDGETGTSHNIVQKSSEQIQMGDTPISKVTIIRVIDACEKAKDSLRIWWAGGELNVEQCTSIKGVTDTIIRQAKTGSDIAIGYERKK